MNHDVIHVLKYAFRIHDFGDKCYSTKPCLVIHDVASVGPFLDIPSQIECQSRNQGYPLGEDARFTDFEKLFSEFLLNIQVTNAGQGTKRNAAQLTDPLTYNHLVAEEEVLSFTLRKIRSWL